jgi:hypothetical protein
VTPVALRVAVVDTNPVRLVVPVARGVVFVPNIRSIVSVRNVVLFVKTIEQSTVAPLVPP